MLGVQRAQAADWVQGLGHVSFVRLFLSRDFTVVSTVPYCLTCKSRALALGGSGCVDGELGRGRLHETAGVR